MTKGFHLRIDIRGMLLRSEPELEGAIIDDDGRKLTGREVKERLMDELQRGLRFLPAGECDNWDVDEEICRGHVCNDA